MRKQTINRAYSIDNIENKKFIELQLDEDFEALVGEPEASGVWLIWGLPANGKTSLTMQLAKVLSTNYKVAYDSFEMGTSKALKSVLTKSGMHEVKKNFLILDKESIPELKERLRKKQAPRIIIIDSLQYADLNKKEYKALKEEFAHRHLFIFISHAKGKEPEGALAGFVRYDADLKIRVEGFKAFAEGRFGGGEPYVIWPEGAAKYWMDID